MFIGKTYDLFSTIIMEKSSIVKKVMTGKYYSVKKMSVLTQIFVTCILDKDFTGIQSMFYHSYFFKVRNQFSFVIL